ncbi:coniferyl aldehyde dehydrogenase [Pseudoalteromonas shioyasakiensis]|uniref:coniferyl aldehyde dehydrogenase n=1 Tax=Pseudoalteromonas shioyasakiensis TaxID=1190813 RepID=UPI00211878A3|nr:coniferyl aldehyde dehydrogenase [Pseudoalteromonas shioyasakiensis]MCQ8878521.1 coniferyl aldehyde dehydrogenase [Pseudoalteromonas shioyasakiensis]
MLLTENTAETSLACELIPHFEQMQQRFKETPYLAIAERIRLLKLLRRKLITLESDLIAATSKDFGYRTAFDTVMGDLLPSVKAITHTIKHLPKWVKDSPRQAGMSLAPSKVSVSYQPKGVVGVISPWNYPIQLALVPVITALAAGNRVLLKLSEFTPSTNQVLKQLFTEELADHCTVIEGEAQLSQQFSRLPFAHLFFTGSTNVGRHVMAAASENLTPVSLELGGKSPVIITADADITKAAKTILFGKMSNAGQICVAPDYVFVPKQLHHQLIHSLCTLYKKYYPQGVEEKNMTSVISSQHFSRLSALLDDANSKGAQVVKPLEENMADEAKHRMGLHLVTHVDNTMSVMQEEIFGPILPILEYDNICEVVSYINARPHPLALYVIGSNTQLIQDIEKGTQSGTFAVNDTLLQVTADDVPFGGVGESGMGNYHGKEGFITFSHARNKLQTGKFNPRLNLLLSHNKLLVKALKWLYLRP